MLHSAIIKQTKYLRHFLFLLEKLRIFADIGVEKRFGVVVAFGVKIFFHLRRQIAGEPLFELDVKSAAVDGERHFFAHLSAPIQTVVIFSSAKDAFDLVDDLFDLTVFFSQLFLHARHHGLF